MQNNEIIERCTNKLGMSPEDAAWVATNLDRYSCPDFSEMSWEEIDTEFLSVLFFKDKSDSEIEALLGV